MKTVAVICEYNPFHYGHLIQISKIRESFGEDCRILALMSGSVTQRGTLPLCSKALRAKAALLCGVDLVLELPAPYCCSSAEFFARGAVGILEALSCIDVLCFGSENGELSRLLEVAENLRREEFREALKSPAAGLSHMRAAAELYRARFGEGFPTRPNDILAVEYLSALAELGGGIAPFTYRREPGFSASAAREAVREGKGEAHLPPAAKEVFADAALSSEALYGAVALHTLRTTPAEVLEGFAGMNGGVGGCLKNRADGAASLEELLSLCASKKHSISRLRRAVLAAVLGITPEEVASPPLFSALLAANAAGRQILAEAKRAGGLPIVTKSRDRRSLSAEATAQYEKSLRADALFSLTVGEAPAVLWGQRPYII